MKRYFHKIIQYIRVNRKNTLLLLLILFIASSTRFFLLDRIPSGITNDELQYILTAKSVFLTGKEINGLWSPYSFTIDPSYLLVPVARTVYIIISPFIGILKFSLFNARLPFVLANIALIFILYLITKITLNSKAAFLVGIIASINPWLMFIGRTSYEAPLALFFVYLTFLILLITKKWKILLAIPLFVITIYSYYGFSIILFPFLVFVVIFVWLENSKKYTLQYLFLILSCLIITAFFVLSIKQQRISYRLSEISTPNTPVIAQMVNDERKLSVKTPFIQILSNKYTAYVTYTLSRYSEVFSSDFLFIYGDSTFSLRYHGAFYYFDLLFIFSGIYYLLRFKKKLFFLLTGIILISPISSAIETVTQTYMLRSAMLLPVLLILIGTGIWFLSKYISKKYMFLFFGLITVIYAISFINFANVYFLRNPIYNSERFAFSNRIVARYLYFAQKENQQTFVLADDSSHNLFKQVTFYNNELNNMNAVEFSKKYRMGVLQFKDVRFGNCGSKFDTNKTIIEEPTCKNIKKYFNKLTVPLLADGGTVYYIYNDTICSKYKLNRFPQNITLNDLDVESLSEKTFCQVYITNLN